MEYKLRLDHIFRYATKRNIQFVLSQ